MSESATYLTVEQARAYVGGFDTDDAFRKWASKYGVPKFYAGRTLRFLRRDLDEALGNFHISHSRRASRAVPVNGVERKQAS